MKIRNFFLIIFISFLVFSVYAAGGRAEENVEKEEAEGGEIWGKIQNKERVCSDLSDEDFERLGEYFMGQMLRESHDEMNKMMIQMMGQEGEEQTHIVMGKRLSGCDTSAEFPSQGTGFMPMMQMMMGGWSSSAGFNNFNKTNNPMMWNFGNNPMLGLGWFGGIFMIIFWVLIIAGIIIVLKWFAGESRKTYDYDKSSLEILKKRYARGEINKEEFEEKKKDIL